MKILITGVAGTGKSSICKVLQGKGYIAYDMDKIPGLCNWKNKSTGKLGDYHENRNQTWIDEHDWLCDKTRIKQLLKENKDVIMCGIASNMQELLPLFDKVLLLSLDDQLILQRLSNRVGDHDFAKTQSEQVGVLSWKDGWEQEMTRLGAISINTGQSLEKIATQIVRYFE